VVALALRVALPAKHGTKLRAVQKNQSSDTDSDGGQRNKQRVHRERATSWPANAATPVRVALSRGTATQCEFID
jgi:hypothetical protein